MNWKRFFRRGTLDNDFAQEIESHLAHEVDLNVAAGMSPGEARRAAMRKLGNVTSLKETIREMNTIGIIEAFWQDLRHGLRLLRLNPAFGVVATLSLALGMGANGAIFQLLDAVRLRNLPVASAQELVEVRILPGKGGRSGWFVNRRPNLTHALWERIHDRQQTFSGVFAWSATRFNLANGGESRPAEGLWVSGDYFNVLRVPALLGRTFVPADDVQDCSNAGAVISYGFWQKEFGGEPSAVGRKLTLDGHPFEVIGVTPASFFGVEVGRNFDVAIPLCTAVAMNDVVDPVKTRHYWWLAVIGRLKPGVTIEQATAGLETLSPAMFEETLPPTYQAEDAKNYLSFKLETLDASAGVSSLRTNYERPLWLLLAASGLVLLIACANIANLMLARANARIKEISVRLAIGASRGRLIRQLLAESLLVAVTGAVFGALLAQALSRVLLSFLSTTQNRLWLDFRTDWRLLLFMGGLAAITCLIFGLVPAFKGTRIQPADAMRASGRGFTAGHERINFRRVLIVSQVALSLVLLVGALLFVRSLTNLLTLDSGFTKEGLLIAHVNAGRLQLKEPQRRALFDELSTALESVPGVESLAETFIVPIAGGGWNNNVIAENAAGVKLPKALSNFNRVSKNYFRTMGTPLIAGRDFDQHDTQSSRKVAIVDQAFKQKVLQGADPVGLRFEIEPEAGRTPEVFEIIGLVQNSKYQNLRDEFAPTAYVAMSQEEHPRSSASFVIRSDMPLTTLMPAVKSAIMSINDDASLGFDVFSTRILESLRQEQLMATLSAFFGLLAGLLATMGLYGMLSYTVTQRRSEIGIRMVLGADRRGVVRMILREASVLLVIGLAIGTAASIAVARTAETLLYGLAPRDPLTIIGAILALAIVALAASYLPARRAANLEPSAVLKEE